MLNVRKFTLYVLCLGVSLWGMQLAQASNLPGFVDLVKETSSAVVNISTTQKVKSGMPELPEGFEMPEFPEDSPFGELFKYFFEQEENGDPGYHDAKSLGSGFIISKDGYVMTNYHVVKDGDEIIVRLSDRRELKAEIIGVDPRSDVALLKIDATGLPVARIGKSSDLEVGEWVLAIGSPFGFDHSATAGIVSAKGRSLPRENYVPFIQTDVAINPGNSGGPLFNQEGEVVGVNSQIYSRTGGYMGLSFAIPIEVAMDVADQLKTSGKVSRGWLGVLIQDVTLDLAESFGMRHPRGALVAKVLPESPALAAGVEVGDDTVEVDTEDELPIDHHSAPVLTAYIVVSDMPYPSVSGTPIARNQLRISAGIGAAPEIPISHSSSPISPRTVLNATSSRKFHVASSSSVAVPAVIRSEIGSAASIAS